MSNSYLDRAMRHRDPRYRQILEKMGYKTRVMKPELSGNSGGTLITDELPEIELATARAEYKELVGRAPYHGWDLQTIREKIEKAKS